MQDTQRYLLISLGNPLRGDDAVAHKVADSILLRTRGTVSVLKRTLLDVSDLPYLGELDPAVLFIVDACRTHFSNKGCTILSGDALPTEKGVIRHTLHPAEYLGVASLFGCRPKLYMVLIAGERFEHGTEISPFALQNAHEATEEIINIMNNKECYDDKNFSITRER